MLRVVDMPDKGFVFITFMISGDACCSTHHVVTRLFQKCFRRTLVASSHLDITFPFFKLKHYKLSAKPLNISADTANPQDSRVSKYSDTSLGGFFNDFLCLLAT